MPGCEDKTVAVQIRTSHVTFTGVFDPNTAVPG